MPAINEILKQGRYRIDEQTAQTETTAVYKAFDKTAATNVLLREISVGSKNAVGVIQPEVSKIVFDAEAKLLVELKHQSLGRVLDYFSEAGNHYLVLESIEGDSFSQLLEKNKKGFSYVKIAALADVILDALECLHTNAPPIFHRDVKPQNVKLTLDGKIKLIAFGIAGNVDARPNPAVRDKNLDQTALSFSPLEQIWEGLDRASQNVISNSYDEKSERILNQPPDARTDVYAVGATLYYLLTARLPIDALTRSIDILEGKPDSLPSPNRLDSTIPPEISDVLMKALEIRRENRFASALLMRQALHRAAPLKERQTRKVQEREDLLPDSAAKPEKSVSEQQIIEREKSKIEAAQKRQTELIKQQLRESEARCLEAEQRALIAEKRLSEKENEISDEKKSLTKNVTTAVNLGRKSNSLTAEPVTSKKRIVSEDSADEFKDLFVQPKKDNRIWRRMAAAALALVIFSGAFLGIQFQRAFKSAESNQSVSEQTVSLTNEISVEQTVEAAPLPLAATPEIIPTATASENTGEGQITASLETPVYYEPPAEKTTPKIAQTAVSRNLLKNKLQPIQPIQRQIEKPTPPLITPPKKARKTVTVDDIINDK